MKLIHKDIRESIIFEENLINVWVIEDKKMFYQFVQELNEQVKGEDGGFTLSDNGENFKIKDQIEVVTDIFNFEFNNKKIQSRIIKSLTEYAEEELGKDVLELKARLFEFVNKLIDKSGLDIVADDVVDVSDIIKSMNLKVEFEYGSLLENIVNYLKLSINLFEDQGFVFINLKQYLTIDEIEALYNFIIYEKINILLIENSEGERLNNEKYLILDKDYCII